MQKIRYNSQFGVNLRAARIKCGLTQGQVAAQMQIRGFKMSRETYAKIESGIANIRVDELVELSRIFKSGIADFFEGI